MAQHFKAKNKNWEICSSRSGLDVAPGQVNDKVYLVHISRHGCRNKGIPFWGPVFTSSVLAICGFLAPLKMQVTQVELLWFFFLVLLLHSRVARSLCNFVLARK